MRAIVRRCSAPPLPGDRLRGAQRRRAASAGVFITMAANVAAMAPGTNIGAAHPVPGRRRRRTGDMQKVENYAAALARTIAQQRGRNVEWAEKAVRESGLDHRARGGKLKVVDFVADNLPTCSPRSHGRTVETARAQGHARTPRTPRCGASTMSLRQRVLDLSPIPNIAYLLMMAGLLGLYVEFTNPGVDLSRRRGGICLLLALSRFQSCR